MRPIRFNVFRKKVGERGNVMLLLALALPLMILPMVGLAIDATVCYLVQAKLSSAVDGASLGAGRLLVRRLLVELARRAGARDRAAAVIRLGNDASERMFTALGFALTLELVSYSKTDHRPAVTGSATQPSP